MTCLVLSIWRFNSEKTTVGTVTTGCRLCVQRSACKAAARGPAGPSHLQIPFGNTCALALPLVLSRDLDLCLPMGAQSRAVGFLQAVTPGMASPACRDQ